MHDLGRMIMHASGIVVAHAPGESHGLLAERAHPLKSAADVGVAALPAVARVGQVDLWRVVRADEIGLVLRGGDGLMARQIGLRIRMLHAKRKRITLTLFFQVSMPSSCW